MFPDIKPLVKAVEENSKILKELLSSISVLNENVVKQNELLKKMTSSSSAGSTGPR